MAADAPVRTPSVGTTLSRCDVAHIFICIGGEETRLATSTEAHVRPGPPGSRAEQDGWMLRGWTTTGCQFAPLGGCPDRASSFLSRDHFEDIRNKGTTGS